jgi:hypothetical protein
VARPSSRFFKSTKLAELQVEQWNPGRSLSTRSRSVGWHRARVYFTSEIFSVTWCSLRPFVLQSPPRRGARLDRWKQRRNETCLSTSVCLTRRREGRRKRARPGCKVGEDFPRFYRFLPGLVARFECLTVLSIRLFLALSLLCACSTDTFHGC